METCENNSFINSCFLRKLTIMDELTTCDFKIILYLLHDLDDKTFKPVSQKEICEKLYIDKSTVSKSFGRLLSLNILERKNNTKYKKKEYKFCNLN